MRRRLTAVLILCMILTAAWPQTASAAQVPEAYMNHIEEVSARYPATREQAYNDCWAFSAVGLAEFDMITDNKTADKTVDFSELQLAYFTYNHVEDPLEGTYGDTFSISGYSNYLLLGGNLDWAARALLQWQGLAGEAVIPYQATSAPKKLSVEDAYQNNAVHLQNVYCIDIHKNPSGLKQEIMKHGAAGVGYYAAGDEVEAAKYVGSCSYDGRVVPTYYCSRKLLANHAVNVVGWDDDFPADGFAQTAPGNGAWLIRNSWEAASGYGTEINSYFWLSYYDASLESEAWIYDFEDVNNYDHNYQYDGGVTCENVYTKYDAVANVFQVKAEDNETLKAVSLSLMYEENMPYTIKVYTNLRSRSKPTSGYLAAKVTGKTSYCGVYTIPLNSAVPLAKGTTFSVVIELGKKGAGVDIECGGIYPELGITTKTYIEPEQSLARSGSSWEDMEEKNITNRTGNWCIKAYTGSLAGAKVPQVNNVKKKAAGKSSITVKWNKAGTADGYEIFRATGKNGTYKKIATVKSKSKTAYKDTGLTKNKTYYYRVRAYKNNVVTNADGSADKTTTVGKMSSVTAIKTTK